jgi:hypothetical protein
MKTVQTRRAVLLLRDAAHSAVQSTVTNSHMQGKILLIDHKQSKPGKEAAGEF